MAGREKFSKENFYCVRFFQTSLENFLNQILVRGKTPKFGFNYLIFRQRRASSWKSLTV